MYDYFGNLGNEQPEEEKKEGAEGTGLSGEMGQLMGGMSQMMMKGAGPKKGVGNAQTF